MDRGNQRRLAETASPENAHAAPIRPRLLERLFRRGNKPAPSKVESARHAAHPHLHEAQSGTFGSLARPALSIPKALSSHSTTPDRRPISSTDSQFHDISSSLGTNLQSPCVVRDRGHEWTSSKQSSRKRSHHPLDSWRPNPLTTIPASPPTAPVVSASSRPVRSRLTALRDAEQRLKQAEIRIDMARYPLIPQSSRKKVVSCDTPPATPGTKDTPPNHGLWQGCKKESQGQLRNPPQAPLFSFCVPSAKPWPQFAPRFPTTSAATGAKTEQKNEYIGDMPPTPTQTPTKVYKDFSPRLRLSRSVDFATGPSPGSPRLRRQPTVSSVLADTSSSYCDEQVYMAQKGNPGLIHRMSQPELRKTPSVSDLRKIFEERIAALSESTQLPLSEAQRPELSSGKGKRSCVQSLGDISSAKAAATNLDKKSSSPRQLFVSHRRGAFSGPSSTTKRLPTSSCLISHDYLPSRPAVSLAVTNDLSRQGHLRPLTTEKVISKGSSSAMLPPLRPLAGSPSVLTLRRSYESLSKPYDDCVSSVLPTKEDQEHDSLSSKPGCERLTSMPIRQPPRSRGHSIGRLRHSLSEDHIIQQRAPPALEPLSFSSQLSARLYDPDKALRVSGGVRDEARLAHVRSQEQVRLGADSPASTSPVFRGKELGEWKRRYERRYYRVHGEGSGGPPLLLADLGFHREVETRDSKGYDIER